MSAKGANLVTRIATALVVLPAALALIWVDFLRDGFLLFVAVLVCAGLAEYYRLAKARGLGVEFLPGVAAGTLVTLSAWGADGIHVSGALCVGVKLRRGSPRFLDHGCRLALGLVDDALRLG